LKLNLKLKLENSLVAIIITFSRPGLFACYNNKSDDDSTSTSCSAPATAAVPAAPRFQ
jgi:hypothetical protein